MLIYGQTMYGKVDEVPGFCWISTQFFHLYYVPLIPLQSFVILAGSEGSDGFQGTPTRMSMRSVLVAWLRTDHPGDFS